MRRRTIQDRLISGANRLRFAMTEPVELRLARARHGAQYSSRDSNPLVTVIVPTFNRGQILMERAVPSVLGQTHTNIELLILGNQCTDNTEVLLSSIQDPRLVFYNLPRGKARHPDDIEIYWLVGAIGPNNRGLELARGRWITWLGDDDIWTPDHVETLLRFAQEDHYEFVSAQYVEERFGQRKIVEGERARGPYHTRRQADLDDRSPKIGGIQTWLYRSYLRFFRHNVHCWRKSWNRPVDVDLYLRMYESGVRMGYLERVVAYVLPRPEESTIGLEAYKLTEREKLAAFNAAGGNSA